MKKALIIAAVVNLLLCSGLQALSASGWNFGEKSIYRYTDANGDIFYVRENEDGIVPLDLVDGFELPRGSYVIEEDGTFIPPTILNITSLDGNIVANPTKWRPTGKSYEIVSSVKDMTDPQKQYLLRTGSEKNAELYTYKEAFGDHGVPVYDKLPETVVEGQTIAVDGRKYVGVIKPVLGRHYTNAVDIENITVDHRYNSGGQLQALDGYIAIKDIEIPEHIMEKARNGEVVTVRFKGFDLRANCHNGYGFGAATLQYYQDGALILNSAASQIYKEADTDSQSDEDVWIFYLYYRTSNELAENNRYSTTMAKGDSLALSGGVSPTSVVPFDYDLSKVTVTFDEIIGETYRDQLVWEYVDDYETPNPAGFYPHETLLIADMEEDMEDVRRYYVSSLNGMEYFYADYMNALLRHPDGTVRYYIHGVSQHAGACVDFDGNYYYVNHTHNAVVNCDYTFADEKGNGLLPGGTYRFDGNGVCITLPEVIDHSDPTDIRNGLVRVPGGGIRYLVDGVPQHRGLVRDKHNNYYYINNTTYAVTDCTYSFVDYKGNGLIPGGTFIFDENGYITNLPEVIDGGNPLDIQNGLLKFPNGDVRYLVNGVPVHKGLVQAQNGDVYYINHTTHAVKDVYYPAGRTNSLLPQDGYTFDENGVLMSIEVPVYWRDELKATIDEVSKLKEDIGSDAISFIQITDMHIDTVPKTTSQKWFGALAANIMNSCDVPFVMITGDNNTRAAFERPTPSIIYENVALQDQYLSAIGWNRIARILGNHDGIWGNDAYYYDRSMTMAEKYQTFCGRQIAAYNAYCTIPVQYGVNEKAPYDAYFYVDDEATKVRYINLNAHWAEYTVDDGYHPTYNTFTNYYHYGQAQLEWLATEALDVEEGWTVALFTHVPPITQYGPIVENGSSITQKSKDQYILMGILNAYASRTAYTGQYKQYGDWRDVSVSVDYRENSATAAKGEIAGVFAGHTHEDSIHYECSKYFPVITLKTAEGLGAGDRYELSFDTVVIDPEKKGIYMIRTGYGSDRVAKYTPDGSGVIISGGTYENPVILMD